MFSLLIKFYPCYIRDAVGEYKVVVSAYFNDFYSTVLFVDLCLIISIVVYIRDMSAILPDEEIFVGRVRIFTTGGKDQSGYNCNAQEGNNCFQWIFHKI